MTCFTDQPTLKKLDPDDFADTESSTSDEAPSKPPISTKPIATKERSGGKRKSVVELQRQELLSTCIQVLKEPMPQLQPQPVKCVPFGQYVSEKLGQFDRRTRIIIIIIIIIIKIIMYLKHSATP